MGAQRFDVSIEEFGQAIRLWIRGSPPSIWKRDQLYEELRSQKRHDPSKAPDPRGDLAAYITDQLVRAGWQVTRPEPENIFEGIGEGPDWRKKRGLDTD
jgi:hypothetical protein